MASVARRSPTSRPNSPAARARTARTAVSASPAPRTAARLGLQPGRLTLGVEQGGQPLLPLAPELHDGTEVVAVLAPQLRQEAPALLDKAQALRVVLPALELVAQRPRHVGQVDGCPVQALAVGVESLPARQGSTGAPEDVEGPALGPGGVDQLHGGERSLAIGRRIGQTVLLPAQRHLLVGVLHVRGGDLVHLVAQHVRLPGPLLLVAPERRQPIVEGADLAPQRAHHAQVRAGEGIEHVTLRAGPDERAVFVLPVDLDQQGRRFAQRPQGRHAAVDPGPRPALGRHRAGEDHLALGVALADDEARLDERLGSAGPHHGRVGPSPQHQLERLDDQRLAGAGLSGERGHAGAEFERQVLDHAQVAHPQVGQHGGLTRRDGPGGGSAGWCRTCAARSGPRAPGAPPPGR